MVPLYADMTGSILPGLASLGIQALLIPVQTNESHIMEKLKEPTPVYTYAGNPEAVANLLQDDESLPVEDRLFSLQREYIGWRENSTILLRDGFGDVIEYGITDFSENHTHILQIESSPNLETNRAKIHSALLRWVTHNASFPECILAIENVDESLRGLACEFLIEISGQKKDPVSLRLRHAAQAIAAGDIQDAYNKLKSATLRNMNLPPTIMGSLTGPDNQKLTDTEISDLIYMARAGCKELRILAVQRLRPEIERKEVYSTIEQLRFDADSWVRAAATARSAERC